MGRTLKAIHTELSNISSERSKVARREKVLLNREQKLLLELKKHSTRKNIS
tara:strand:- start:2463 stop:2615 length:153 start_codon:yes stop_codon:yes gene_type:complete